MGLILDTSVIIEAEKKRLSFKKFSNLGNAYMSAITVSELLLGVHLASDEEKKIKRATFVEKVIKSIASLPFQEEEARIYARLIAHLRHKHIMIDAHDVMIAATALEKGFPVLTTNVKHFDPIPGLKIITPE